MTAPSTKKPAPKAPRVQRMPGIPPLPHRLTPDSTNASESTQDLSTGIRLESPQRREILGPATSECGSSTSSSRSFHGPSMVHSPYSFQGPCEVATVPGVMEPPSIVVPPSQSSALPNLSGPYPSVIATDQFLPVISKFPTEVSALGTMASQWRAPSGSQPPVAAPHSKPHPRDYYGPPSLNPQTAYPTDTSSAGLNLIVRRETMPSGTGSVPSGSSMAPLQSTLASYEDTRSPFFYGVQSAVAPNVSMGPYPVPPVTHMIGHVSIAASERLASTPHVPPSQPPPPLALASASSHRLHSFPPAATLWVPSDDPDAGSWVAPDLLPVRSLVLAPSNAPPCECLNDLADVDGYDSEDLVRMAADYDDPSTQEVRAPRHPTTPSHRHRQRRF